MAKSKYISLRDWCDQCEALAINGHPCHEHGCPNERKQKIDGQWVRVLQCRECDGDVVEGEVCSCQEETENAE